MNFLLTFPTTCAAVYLLRKPIKRWPVVFYLCAIALDTLYLASGFIVLPRWLWGILVELVQRCELALALFAIVMLIGCLDSTSRLHRRLSPIRGELSIIAWILAMSHVTVYAVSYLPRLLSTNNLDENIVVSMAVALILLALLTVLGITSLNVVKRIMTATTWNRAQRLSYVFFGLVFCHLAFILAPGSSARRNRRAAIAARIHRPLRSLHDPAHSKGDRQWPRATPATRNPGPPARLLVRSRRKSHRLVFIHSEVKGPTVSADVQHSDAVPESAARWLRAASRSLP